MNMERESILAMENNLTSLNTPDAKTWREGYEAALHGLDSSCNPYDAEQALFWLTGFAQGLHSGSAQ